MLKFSPWYASKTSEGGHVYVPANGERKGERNLDLNYPATYIPDEI
jgi:hypothetical protein